MQVQLEYFLRSITGKLGKPFNGQMYRSELFKEILNQFNFDAVIETGTNRGSTTQYIAENFSGPIFSVEYSPKYFEFSKIRTKRYANVEIYMDNSINGLKKIFDNNKFFLKNLLLYLDAHWYDYLPLKDELSIILQNNEDINSVIMIDDFEVPLDKDYGFDSYSTGTLNYSYIEPVLPPNSSVFFPKTPGRRENGFKRGCAVISSNPRVSNVLEKNSLLTNIETLKS
jgi:hypothetical protein